MNSALNERESVQSKSENFKYLYPTISEQFKDEKFTIYNINGKKNTGLCVNVFSIIFNQIYGINI